MGKNSITSIPQAFKPHARSLIKLSLARNRLKDFNPEVAKSMTELADLDLSFNFLTIFPYEEGNLPNLVNLDIKGNPILAIPKFVIRTKLENLFLEWDHVVKEESYLKAQDDQKAFPSIDSFLRSSFLISIEKIKEAFYK